MKSQFLALALSFCSLMLGGQASAQEDVERELLEFCKRSPLNSRCKGVKAPISLKEREGIEVECQLRFGGNDKIESCKYFVEGDTLTVYVEVGEQIEMLDNLQPTKEIKITSENLLFFPTVSDYKWKIKFKTQVDLLLESDYDLFFKLEEKAKGNRSNRISIYFKNLIRDIKRGKEQDLIKFLQSKQRLNTDKKAIDSKLENLQSTSANLTQSQAIQRLLDDKSCVRCDLSGADLSEADLENANLEGANLSNAILTDANLDRAYLLGANMQNAVLNNSSLKYAELPYSSLNGADLHSARFSASNLIGTSLVNANLSSAELNDFTSLKFSNLNNANLEGAKLEGVNLNDANLRSANLKNASVSSDAVIKRNTAYIVKSSFKNANLTDANLTNITASGVVFDRANLSNAVLAEADLSVSKFGKNELFNSLMEADLTNADLSNSQLDRANFSGARLQDANLNNANLESAVLCKTTMPDGSISEAGCQDEE